MMQPSMRHILNMLLFHKNRRVALSFSLLMSLEKEDLRNLGRKLEALLGEMSDRLSRDLDLLGITSVPASSTLDTDPAQ
jgi:hypothetical protein